MASTVLNDKKVRTIHLGSTYKRKRQTSLHTLRYDFKPASVDLSQTGRIEVQENNEIEVTLPSSIKKGNIVYTGSKKPALKECVLIYDPVTDEFTLEKVASQCYIKKTRASNSKMPAALPQPPLGLQKLKKNATKKPSSSQKSSSTSKQAASSQQQQQGPPHTGRKQELVQEERMDRSRSISPTVQQHTSMQAESPFGSNIGSRLSSSGEDSSSDSSSSSSEDEGSDTAPSAANTPSVQQQPSSNLSSQVLDDLELTSSGSDSD